MELSKEQQTIKDLVNNTKDHVFVTGKAGTGKSVLLRSIADDTSKKHVICSPTGIAAVNIGGKTIHSMFSINPKYIPESSVGLTYQKQELLQALDTIIIDEVSMLSVDLLDRIDQIMQYAKKDPRPFGNTQMVFFGDLYQLPPVPHQSPLLKKYMAAKYINNKFFYADALREVPLIKYELKHIFRQSDEEFKTALNCIREGIDLGTALKLLNTRAGILKGMDDAVTLTSLNQAAWEINFSKLKVLPGELKTYKANIHPDFKESNYPTEAELHLKVGAQVMLIRNHPEGLYFNGTVGEIATLDDECIQVYINGEAVAIPKVKWSQVDFKLDKDGKIQHDKEVVFEQYPIKWGWAMSIHKSQGQTLDKAVIDLGKRAFATGQTYVALSRCKTLQGLSLTRPIQKSDIKVDDDVLEFMKDVRTVE